MPTYAWMIFRSRAEPRLVILDHEPYVLIMEVSVKAVDLHYYLSIG